MTRRLVAILLLLSTAGCYAWRPTATAPGRLVAEQSPPSIRATMMDGRMVTVSNPTLVNDTIVGATAAGEERAAAADVLSVDVRRLSVTRTVSLFVMHASAVVGLIAAIVHVQPHYRGF
jgi:hypothetical protein